MNALVVSEVVSGYGGTDVLRGVSATIERGSCVALVGPNGAGKSTLLRSISGELKLRGGSRTVGGNDLTHLGPHGMARHGVRWVGDPRPIYASMNVDENLAVGASMRRSQATRLRTWVFDLLPILEEKRGDRAGSLSGGQQQMLAIGQALMSEPTFLLLDEPSIGLAPTVVDTVAALVDRLRTENVGIMWAEQFPELAMRHSDHVLVMGSGQVLAQGHPDELPREHLDTAYIGAVPGDFAVAPREGGTT